MNKKQIALFIVLIIAIIDDNTAEIVSIKRQLSDVVYKINSLISDINLYILSR